MRRMNGSEDAVGLTDVFVFNKEKAKIISSGVSQLLSDLEKRSCRRLWNTK